jgi:hypothetical protein
MNRGIRGGIDGGTEGGGLRRDESNRRIVRHSRGSKFSPIINNGEQKFTVVYSI